MNKYEAEQALIRTIVSKGSIDGRDDFVKALTIIDEWDRYGTTDYDSQYRGSPFQERVNKFLHTYGLRDEKFGFTKLSSALMEANVVSGKVWEDDGDMGTMKEVPGSVCYEDPIVSVFASAHHKFQQDPTSQNGMFCGEFQQPEKSPVHITAEEETDKKKE